MNSLRLAERKLVRYPAFGAVAIASSPLYGIVTALRAE